MRRQMLALHPEVANALDELAGKISEQEMQQLNYTVDGKHGDIKIVVQDFLRKKNLAGTRASNSRRRTHQLQWQTHAES